MRSDECKEVPLKPFVLNRHGRLALPSNFFPEIDFSRLETLEQLCAVVKRDFEEKAPTAYCPETGGEGLTPLRDDSSSAFRRVSLAA
jgi:hypothetical protein